MADGGWISKNAFQDGALSADAEGRAAMADGFLSADATGRAKLGDGLINNDKIADGTIQLAKMANSKLLYTGVYGYSEYGRAVYG